jgi:hypothetical protein
MATRTITETFSDLSGEGDASTYHLAFEGMEYVVDLTKTEHDELLHMLKPYMKRKVPLAERTRRQRRRRVRQQG